MVGVLVGIAWVYHGGYTTLCTYPTIPPWVHLPHSGCTCRTAARLVGASVAALTLSVTVRTLTDEPLTVSPTRFTVGRC